MPLGAITGALSKPLIGAAIGGGLGFLGSRGSRPGTTYSQTRSPFTDAFGGAAKSAAGGLNDFFRNRSPYGYGAATGRDTIARPNEDQFRGLDVLGQNAEEFAGNSVINSIFASQLQNAQRSAEGAYLDPRTNPALQGSFDYINRLAQENLENNIIPNQISGAIASGGYGGARDARNIGRVTETYGREQGAAFANALRPIYGAEREAQRNVGADVIAAYNFRDAPAQKLFEVGALKQQLEQSGLDADRQNYENQQRLSEGFAQALQLLANFGGTTSTSSGTGQQQSSLRDALLGALGGGQLSKVLFPTTTNPFGSLKFSVA